MNIAEMEEQVRSAHAIMCQRLSNATLKRRALKALRRPWRPVMRRFRFSVPEEDAEESFLKGFKPLNEVTRLPSGFITHYSLKPDTATWLFDYVSSKRCRGIVELGCGISTIVIALALKRSGIACDFISIESEADWLGRTAKALNAIGVENLVDLRHGPLKRIENGSYSIHESGPLGNFAADLLFVDAPPREIGRGGALFAFHSILKDGACVVLDDARREEELEVALEWQKSGLAHLEGFAAIGCGLALFRVKNEKPRRIGVRDSNTDAVEKV